MVGLIPSNGLWDQALMRAWEMFFRTSPIMKHRKSDQLLYLKAEEESGSLETS